MKRRWGWPTVAGGPMPSIQPITALESLRSIAASIAPRYAPSVYKTVGRGFKSLTRHHENPDRSQLTAVYRVAAQTAETAGNNGFAATKTGTVVRSPFSVAASCAILPLWTWRVLENQNCGGGPSPPAVHRRL